MVCDERVEEKFRYFRQDTVISEQVFGIDINSVESLQRFSITVWFRRILKRDITLNKGILCESCYECGFASKIPCVQNRASSSLHKKPSENRLNIT